MTALFLIALVGATLIVVRGFIFEPIRNLWPAFFGCAQCCGFWIGTAAGAGGVLPDHRRVLDALIMGFATSVSALLADAVLIKLLGDPSEKEGST